VTLLIVAHLSLPIYIFDIYKVFVETNPTTSYMEISHHILFCE